MGRRSTESGSAHARRSRTRPISGAVVLCALVVAALAPAAPALASSAATSGGAYPSSPPRIVDVICRSGCPQASVARAGEAALAAQPGSVVRVTGKRMRQVSTVTFLGARGRADNASTSPLRRRDRWVEARVPDTAVSGRLRVRNADGNPSRASSDALTLPAAAPAPEDEEGAAPGDTGERRFPVQGRFTWPSYGGTFGGGRSHQGNDLMSPCGTPLVATVSGVVSRVTFQARAGHYLILDGDDGVDHAYMHLRERSPVAVGTRVAAGDPLGAVGDSGNAQGCHLHFELWSSPGWYRGGAAFDPQATLREWYRTGRGSARATGTG